MRVVLLGAPGAGKGTQAALAAKRFEIPHISTGDMMRAAIQSGSGVGKKAKEFLDSGQLVPDEVMIGVVKDRLSQPDCEPGYLLDGFPRTLAQAEALGVLTESLGKPVTHVVEFVVPFDLLTERLVKRGETSGRSDDSADVIANRLKVYEELTAPVSKFYASQGTLLQVDGVGSIDEIQTRAVALLQKS